MAKIIDNSPKVVSGEMNTLDYLCEIAESKVARFKEIAPESAWIYEVQIAEWCQIRDAHKNGQKVIAFGGPVPVEIIYAFGCQPYYLDQLPLSLAPNMNAASKFIDICENVTTPSMCGLDKIELGVLLANQYGVVPDAFVYSTVPCDSSRIAYPNMEKIWNVPTFKFDTPFRRDPKGWDYLSAQTKEFIKFMEELTGTKFEWEKAKEVFKVANRTNELLVELAKLRMHTPCPLPSSFCIANGIMSGMSPDPALIPFLESQVALGKMNVAAGRGPCKHGEKYRIMFTQDMLWTNAKTYSWLENELGAVCAMDTMGFFVGDFFEDLDDKDACFRVMSQKMMNFPMIHGASGPVDYYIDRVKYIMDNFNINAAIFLGHVGCKHTWASNKIIADYVFENYGLQTLILDADCVDGRYKSGEEVQNSIKEYLENVVKL